MKEYEDMVFPARRSLWLPVFLPVALFLALFFLGRGSSEAGQGHENCSICHGAHTSKGLLLFPQKFNTGTINPNTKKPLDALDSLCMSCHAPKPEGMGIRPLDLTRKHYFGGKPFLVILPAGAAGFQGGEELFTCVSCHDPHPANENYCYLRTPKGRKIKKSRQVKDFCLWCHPKLHFLLKEIN